MARMESCENWWIQDYPKIYEVCLDWFPFAYCITVRIAPKNENIVKNTLSDTFPK